MSIARCLEGGLTAVSTPRSKHCSTPSDGNASFYEKLNTRWHERALQAFMLIVLAHWGEHLVQAYQIYVMGWPRPKANGILGLWYPWLIQSETLHYGYAAGHADRAFGCCAKDSPVFRGSGGRPPW